MVRLPSLQKCDYYSFISTYKKGFKFKDIGKNLVLNWKKGNLATFAKIWFKLKKWSRIVSDTITGKSFATIRGAIECEIRRFDFCKPSSGCVILGFLLKLFKTKYQHLFNRPYISYNFQSNLRHFVYC